MIALRDGSYWLSSYSAYVCVCGGGGGAGISITDSRSDTSDRWVETRCVNGLLDNFRSGRQSDDLYSPSRSPTDDESRVIRKSYSEIRGRNERQIYVT